MDKNAHHKRVWRLIHWPVTTVFKLLFHYSCEKYQPEGPTLVISNHVTNYDPFFVAASFPKHQMYFVASEHLFRKGWLTKIINYLVAPICRRKGSNGADTAMTMLRALRKGQSVCIFGEGETTWNGLSNQSFPGTGDIAKIGKATLMTYRIEGGYLTAPRWSKGIHRGKMRGYVVNTYTPEMLARMSSTEINDAINRDITENAWERQKEEYQRFKGKRRAWLIETALFLCPKCHQFGTIRGEGHHVRCSCGLDTVFTEYGTFDPPVPFENMLEWDRWQHQHLQETDSLPAFTEDSVRLLALNGDHTQTEAAVGQLKLEDGVMSIGEYTFALKDISHLALVQKHLMIFTHQQNYYELHAPGPVCFRKYLAVWQNQNEKA